MQTKLYKPQTSHTVAVFEALVTSANQLLAAAVAARPQQPMAALRSDTAVQHHALTDAARTDAGNFRRQVSGISVCVLFQRYVIYWLLCTFLFIVRVVQIRQSPSQTNGQFSLGFL